jgi:hypothetical protein
MIRANDADSSRPSNRERHCVVADASRQIHSQHAAARNGDANSRAGVDLESVGQSRSPLVCLRRVDKDRWGDPDGLPLPVVPVTPFHVGVRQPPAEHPVIDNAVVEERMRSQEKVTPLTGARAGPERER